MSNFEQMMIAKALQFQTILKAVDRIRKRGERRRNLLFGYRDDAPSRAAQRRQHLGDADRFRGGDPVGDSRPSA